VCWKKRLEKDQKSDFLMRKIQRMCMLGLF
jgi:hypothetical protein